MAASPQTGFSGFSAPPLRAQKKEGAPASRFEARLDQISSGGTSAPKPEAPAAPEPQADMFAPAEAPPPAAVPEEPAPAAPAAPPPADDLTLIAGVGPTMANDLKGLGIVSFKQLSELSDDEAENVNQQTGFPGRVEREEWREQAVELMAGKPPRAKVDREQRAAAAPDPDVEPAPVPAPAAPDDLSLISGVGPAIAKNLNEFGITTYKQVLALSDEDAERVNDFVGFPGRVQREEWREQAAELMAGKPPRAKLDQEAKAAKPKPKKLPAPAPKAAEAAEAAPGKIAPPSAKDDLTKIKGIGPALQRELQNMGFHTYLQLSELNPEQIAEVNTQIGFPGRVERENWIGQARELLAA